MTPNDTDANESIDLDRRTRRAATECMTVMDDVGDARDAPGLYVVVGENGGGEYLVDTHTGACTCPDAEYRNPAGGCKHVRRARMASCETPVPAGVDVDDQLGDHVSADTSPRAVADGGEIVVAGDDGEILDETDADADEHQDGRPADCQCGEWNDGLALACWPCYRDGFDDAAGE
jgi:hypothetical protein